MVSSTLAAKAVPELGLLASPISQLRAPNAYPERSGAWIFNRMNNNVLTQGAMRLTRYVDSISELLQLQASNLQERSNLAKEAQNVSDAAEEALQALKASNQGVTADLGYANKICRFISDYDLDIEEVYASGTWLNGRKFTIPQFMNTKAALLNFANKLTDVASQKQLELQKVLQSSNQSWLLMNSLQGLQTDLGKSIFQSLR